METPVEWCERMERSAKDGDEAYVYYQLKQIWENRENGINSTLPERVAR